MRKVLIAGIALVAIATLLGCERSGRSGEPDGTVQQTSTTGAPGTPDRAPDPCGQNQCKHERPQLCRNVRENECVDYQGNPPRCRRYQTVTRRVCTPA